MIKAKSAILIPMTALVFAGCGADTAQQSIETTSTLIETSEVRIETPTGSTATTTRTTQTTSKTTTTSTTMTTIASTTTVTTIAEPVLELEPVVTELPIEPETEPPVQEVVEPTDPPTAGTPGGLIYSGMRGTYYAPGSWNGYSAIGGSGRSLLDCNSGDGYARGSIASRYLYNLLGYYSNGGRTAVWLSVAGYPDMDGIYYLDDCSGADVVDFFYNANGNCQFCYAGVVSVDVYYVN